MEGGRGWMVMMKGAMRRCRSVGGDAPPRVGAKGRHWRANPIAKSAGFSYWIDN